MDHRQYQLPKWKLQRGERILQLGQMEPNICDEFCECACRGTGCAMPDVLEETWWITGYKRTGIDLPRKWKKSSMTKKQNIWGIITFNGGKGTWYVVMPSASAVGWKSAIYIKRKRNYEFLPNLATTSTYQREFNSEMREQDLQSASPLFFRRRYLVRLQLPPSEVWNWIDDNPWNTTPEINKLLKKHG